MGRGHLALLSALAAAATIAGCSSKRTMLVVDIYSDFEPGELERVELVIQGAVSTRRGSAGRLMHHPDR
jgi:hypothetical protein